MGPKRTLDITRLPREALVGDGNLLINVASTVFGLHNAVLELAKSGLVKPVESFGFAAAHPARGGTNFHESWHNWDDPYEFVWFVTGWGPEQQRYIANAVRKLRALLREGEDTLAMRINPELGSFQDEVDDVEENGDFLWGDYPWGGATFVHVGDIILPSSVSVFLEVEDDAVAKLGGSLVCGDILKALMPEEFGPDS